MTGLLFEVIGVSASGVLAPGPLFFANLKYGAQSGTKGGLGIATGHMAVELTLVAILAAGVTSTIAILRAHLDVIGILGGAALLGFAAYQSWDLFRARKRREPVSIGKRNPIFIGMALTGLNPFFFVWWLTVGIKLLSDAAPLGLVPAAAAVFGFHIWMDYAWLAATSHLARRGAALVSSMYYRLISAGLIAALCYFGVSFILSAG